MQLVDVAVADESPICGDLVAAGTCYLGYSHWDSHWTTSVILHIKRSSGEEASGCFPDVCRGLLVIGHGVERAPTRHDRFCTL